MNLDQLLQSCAEKQAAKTNEAEVSENAKRATPQFVKEAKICLETVITPTIKTMVKRLRAAGFYAVIGEKAMGSYPPASTGWLSFSIKLRKLVWQLNVIVIPDNHKFYLEIITNTREKQAIQLTVAQITPEKVDEVISTSLAGLLKFEAQIK